MATLCMINARGGSKGLPRKNIRPLCGKPLLAYSIEVAFQCSSIDRTIVSTEDDEIARIAEQWGAEVLPRPAELASDESLQIDTIAYNVREMEKRGMEIGEVVLLQPTAPLRSVEDVEGCLQLLRESGADTVVTVTGVRHHHPVSVFSMAPDGSLSSLLPFNAGGVNRQALPGYYWRTGSVYAVRRSVIVDRHALYGDVVKGYVVAPERSFNIDDIFDWELTEAWIRSRQ